MFIYYFFLEKLRTLALESIFSQWCSNFSPTGMGQTFQLVANYLEI